MKLPLQPQYIKMAVVLCVAAVALTSSRACLAWSDQLSEAFACYRNKQYDQAAEKFVDALRAEPTNVSAAFYAASSYYASGKTKEAIYFYWYVAKEFPESREAYSARAFLKSIDKNYLRDANDKSMGTVPPQPAGSQTKKRVAAQTTEQTEGEKDQLVQQIIVKTPRRSHLDLTPEFVTAITDALKEFPINILRFIAAHNCKVILTPNVIENDFRMQGYSPSGYAEGSIMENVPALFNGKDIVMGEYYKGRYGDDKENAGNVGTLRHEMGHAIDHYLGGISNKEEFKHAFQMEFDSRAGNGKLGYFLRFSRSGQAETFAELCCYKLGGRTDEYRSENCEALHNAMPNCYALVEKALDSLNASQ